VTDDAVELPGDALGWVPRAVAGPAEVTMSSDDQTQALKGRTATRIAAVLLAGVAVLAPSVASAAVSGPAPTPASVNDQQASPVGQPIPLVPLTGLTSLDATVVLNANGTLDGKPARGDLTARLVSNDQGMRQIDVTGSLLGPVVAKVGGSSVKLLRPSRLSVYDVPDGTYIVLSGLFDLCIKTEDPQAAGALDQLSPQGLMSVLTSSDVARGTLAGNETLNDMSVEHYVIDGPTFLAAAQGSSDPTVQAFGHALTNAANADLYVATDGGYPVSYRGGFSGAFEPLALSGDFTAQIDLTGINTNTPIELPGACDHPIPG
jgi:hypothetical protein